MIYYFTISRCETQIIVKWAKVRYNKFMLKYIAGHIKIPVQIARGKGCFLYDQKGREFLDFLGGWCVSTVGWKNKEMAAAISAQAREGLYVPPMLRYPAQDALAKRLIDLAPGQMSKAYRCTSGSEAVEFAIKIARAYTGKQTIVSIDGVYHGHTYGAAAVGDACNREIGPCLPGFIKLPMPKNVLEGMAVISKFEALLKSRNDIAAFLSEPVWTNAGCFIPPAGFYEGIQKLCRKYKVLLAMDEVATCMGRCGKMFASSFWGLEPDIICLGKSFTGGYATMGATLISKKIASKRIKIHSYSTFGWMPQDLAATAKNLDLIVKNKLADNSATVGKYLLGELKGLEKLRKVKAVRGLGMAFGIEFHLPIAPLIVAQCYRNNLLVAESDANTLFFSPPLILDKKLAKQGADILKKVCGIK